MILKNTLKDLNLSPVKVFREMFPEKQSKLINQLAYQYFRRDFDSFKQSELILFCEAVTRLSGQKININSLTKTKTV